MTKWDKVVLKAWLERNDSQSQWWHPAKADRIYARYAVNIDRANAYLTAEWMVERYKYSGYTAYERASDHACSYPSDSRQFAHWTNVMENIVRIQKRSA